MRIIFTIFLVASLVGCEEKRKDPGPTPKTPNNARRKTVNCNAVANFSIPYDTARKWKDTFKVYFKQPYMADSFWIPKSIVIAIRSFLNADTNYDGLRLYTGAARKLVGLRWVDSTELLMAPTMYINDTTHQDKWDSVVAVSDARRYNLNIDTAKANGLRKRFDVVYRAVGTEGSVEALSSGVWFSKCVVDSLAKYLENAALGLDGIRVHNASYYYWVSGVKYASSIGQEYERQSTFVIVVTRPVGTADHQDDWNVLSKYFNKDKWAAYNHGELCPRRCY